MKYIIEEDSILDNSPLSNFLVHLPSIDSYIYIQMHALILFFSFNTLIDRTRKNDEIVLFPFSDVLKDIFNQMNNKYMHKI